MAIIKTGIEVSETQDFQEYQEFDMNGFVERLNASELEPDTDYYVRAFVRENGEKMYSLNTERVTTKGSDFEYFYIQNVDSNNNTITLHSGFDPNDWWSGYDMQYSLDGENWENVSFDGNNNLSIELTEGGKVYFRSTSGFSGSESAYYSFAGTGPFSANGCVYSLINYSTHPDNWETPNKLPGRCFVQMFKDSTNLVDASNLSFDGIYSTEFKSCGAMFYGCSNLINPPDMSQLINIDNSGCESMFMFCGNLVTPPCLNSLVVVSQNGMKEFLRDCYSLREYPNLSHIVYIGQSGLDEAFLSVPNITISPDISNITSVGYHAFRNWCANSQVDTLIAPNLPVWSEDSMWGWADWGLANEGTVVARENLEIPTDTNSGIPTGWSKQNAEPKRGGDTNDYFYIRNLTNEDATFSIVWEGERSSWSEYEFYYSFDKENWTLYLTTSNETITIPANATMYMRSVNLGRLGRFEPYYTNSFHVNKNHAVGGDLLSLYNYGNMRYITTIGEPFLFQDQFKDDTYLIDASELHFTNLKRVVGGSCFQRMFKNCVNLVSVPNFSSIEELSAECYQMFAGCVSIQTGIDLRNVTTVGDESKYGNGFGQLYYGCTSLTTAYAPNVNELNLYEWLEGAPQEGIIYANAKNGLTPYNYGVPAGWAVRNYENPTNNYFYFHNEYNGENTIKIDNSWGVGDDNFKRLMYSYDKVDWYYPTYDDGKASFVVPTNGYLYFKSDNGLGGQWWGAYYHFHGEQPYSIGGKVSTLVDCGNPSSVTTVPDGCLHRLFTDETNLVSISNLDMDNITTIRGRGLSHTFDGCSSLTDVFDFSGVTTIDNNSGEDEGCALDYMFYNCTSLETGLDLSNITSITGHADALTGLYHGCTSLTIAFYPNVSSNAGTQNWLENVAAEGVVYCPTGVSVDTDSSSGIPTGWTREDY